MQPAEIPNRADQEAESNETRSKEIHRASSHRRPARTRARRRPGAGNNQRHGHGCDGLRSARGHRGSAGRSGRGAGDVHRRRRPVHVHRARAGKLRADVLPPRLQRARAGRGGERRRHRHARRRDGHPAAGNGGGRGHARGTAIHRRFSGAHRRHHRPGFHQPGRHGPHQPVADGSPVVQRQHANRSATPPPSCGRPTCATWRRTTR